MKTRPGRTAVAILALALARAADAANIVVTSHDDLDAVDGLCSLREAILAANDDTARNECPAGSGADRIVLDLDAPAIVDLSADLPTVTGTLAIRSASGEKAIVYGQELHRAFVFDSPGGDQWFLVEDLILSGAFTATGDGAAVSIAPGETAVLSRSGFIGNVAVNGGAVYAVGSGSAATALEVVDCEFQANEATGSGGGGAIFAFFNSEVRVRGSSFWGNRAAALGGALYVNRGELTIERSTVSGNEADGGGGGIAGHTATGSVSLHVVDSTITLNESAAGGATNGEGGGIALTISVGQPAELELRNSIVAGNLDSGPLLNPDLWLPAGLTVLATGWNLVGANDGAVAYFAAGTPNAAGDFVGTLAAPIDPLLDPLDYSPGSFTASHRPVLDAASPVIDHGACPGSHGDQLGRGNAATGLRIVPHPAVPDQAGSDGCDIGSFERGAATGVVPELFADGFELGHTLPWTAEAP